MLQKKYRSEIISNINHLDDIFTLEFKSLNGKYKYAPGQFLHLSLDTEYDGTGQWPESRCFSMQSNPDEETIKITYAVKGKFTKQMEQQLRVGSVVWLKLPYGNLFTQPHDRVNTIFIAGGTGITPFLSLFTHKSFRCYINPKIYLGFRTEECNIYFDEINRVYNSATFVKYFYENINGIIDIQYILNQNNKESDYFISGPPLMISAFKQALMENDVPAHKILSDDWE